MSIVVNSHHKIIKHNHKNIMAFLLKSKNNDKLYIELDTNTAVDAMCKRHTNYTMMQWLMTSGDVSELISHFKNIETTSNAESLLIELAMGHNGTIDNLESLNELICLVEDMNLSMLADDLKKISSETVFPISFLLDEVCCREDS